MTGKQLSGNVLGVVHNLKSSLMAVNGYIDLLTPEKSGEVYEHAKRSVGDMESVINDLVFAMRAYRRTEPQTVSLNACVRSVVGLLRSNETFRGKVKFRLELAESDEIYDTPAAVMQSLDAFITRAMTELLGNGNYKLTVRTVGEQDRVFVSIDGDSIDFPRSAT